MPQTSIVPARNGSFATSVVMLNILDLIRISNISQSISDSVGTSSMRPSARVAEARGLSLQDHHLPFPQQTLITSTRTLFLEPARDSGCLWPEVPGSLAN